MNEDVVVSLWQRRVRWSRAADALKNRVNYARGAALGLSCLGAVAETLSATLLADTDLLQTIIGAAGAVSLTAAAFITTQFLTTDSIRRWNRARSVSEAIKHLIYQYRAKVTPFREGNALAELQRKIIEIEAQARDLERYLADIDASDAAPPDSLTPDAYVEKRVRQQIEGYYHKKARLYAQRQRLWRGLEIGLGFTAATVAAVATYIGKSGADTSSIAAWVAVLTTLGGAFAAHSAANRYDFLVMSYYATGRRLQDLLDEWRAQGSPTDEVRWGTFVHACEGAISVENESWMAKWTEQEPGKSG